LRKLFGKLHDAGPLSVRIMPLVSTVLLIAFFVLFAAKKDGLRMAFTGDPADCVPLGVPSLLTVSIMLSTIAFAMAAAASLYVLYRERSAAMNRIVYWHSVLVAAAMAGVAVYMGYWGLIGLRLWA
jgi:hypothetical protein